MGEEIGEGWEDFTFENGQDDAGYLHGKIIFEILTALVGVAEVKALLKGGQGVKGLLKAAKAGIKVNAKKASSKLRVLKNNVKRNAKQVRIQQKIKRNFVNLRRKAFVKHRQKITQKVEKHIFKGDAKKGQAYGGHHWDGVQNGDIQVVGNTRPPNPINDQVFEADIKVKNAHGTPIDKLDAKTGKYKPSTFFPKNWTKQRTLEEIAYAFDNKVKDPNFLNKYIGKTTNGIKVLFQMDVQFNIITIYPLK